MPDERRTPQIRPATPADVDLIAGIMIDSFAEDPVIDYMIPAGPDRERRHRLLRAADVRWDYVRTGKVLIAGDGAGGGLGALLWKPAGARKPSAWEAGRSSLAFVRAVGAKRPIKLLRDLAAVEKKHPKWPHGYMGEIGVRRDAQGQGIGSALLRHALEACDATGTGAFLESSSVANLPLYRRHGFEVVEQVRLGRRGPLIWLMWRQPPTPGGEGPGR